MYPANVVEINLYQLTTTNLSFHLYHPYNSRITENIRNWKKVRYFSFNTLAISPTLSGGNFFVIFSGWENRKAPFFDSPRASQALVTQARIASLQLQQRSPLQFLPPSPLSTTIGATRRRRRAHRGPVLAVNGTCDARLSRYLVSADREYAASRCTCTRVSTRTREAHTSTREKLAGCFKSRCSFRDIREIRHKQIPKRFVQNR